MHDTSYVKGDAIMAMMSREQIISLGKFMLENRQICESTNVEDIKKLIESQIETKNGPFKVPQDEALAKERLQLVLDSMNNAIKHRCGKVAALEIMDQDFYNWVSLDAMFYSADKNAEHAKQKLEGTTPSSKEELATLSSNEKFARLSNEEKVATFKKELQSMMKTLEKPAEKSAIKEDTEQDQANIRIGKT